MRKKILSLFAGVCLLPASSAFAETSEEKLANAIQKLMQQTEQLQKEVSSLRAELDQVKHKNQQTAQNQTPRNTSGASPSATERYSLNIPVTAAQEAQQEKAEFISFMIGSPVLTSPMLSPESKYDAADLIVNYPGINEDLFFLQQRKVLADAIGYENLPSLRRPAVILSGMVEASGTYQDSYGPGPTANSIQLSSVELDVYAEVSAWAHGFLSILYDNGTLDPNLTGSGNAANNGKLYVDRGFLTIGNLTKSPVYFSAGQMYVPFGRYSSNMYTNPLTKSLGRTNVNSVLLGYTKGGAYLSAYAFDGSINIGQSGIGGWGSNVGYKFSSENDVNGLFGVGFINNIADSQVAQSPTGAGFSTNLTTERLQHFVPGVNLHAGMGKGPFSFRSEFVGATRNYSTSDLTFNGKGAAPKALHAEATYGFDIKDKPSNVTLSYGETWEALAMGLPKNSYTATFNTSMWKNTVETLEFRHDINYASTDTAGMICDPGNTGTAGFCLVPKVAGSTQNTILARIAVYF